MPALYQSVSIFLCQHVSPAANKALHSQIAVHSRTERMAQREVMPGIGYPYIYILSFQSLNANAKVSKRLSLNAVYLHITACKPHFTFCLLLPHSNVQKLSDVSYSDIYNYTKVFANGAWVCSGSQRY